MNSSVGIDKDTDLMEIEIGPSHPAMHGIVRFSVSLSGETIVKMKAEIGYLHRAFEKEAENSRYIQILPYTDRLNYCSAIINNCGYSMAVEKLFGIHTPKRAEYARVIMMEVSRISDHMTCVAAAAMEVGAFTIFLWFIKAREYLWELIEDFTGARLTTSWTRFGGNANDFPDGFLDKLANHLIKVQEVIDECDKMATTNKIFVDRLKGVGILSKEKAISYGFTGPMLRAVGVAHDLRVADGGYSAYSDFDFEIPVGEVGDSYDRYLVRMEEMRQSISIIKQASQKIPKGSHITRNRRTSLPPKSEVYGSIEGMIDHFKLIMEGHTPPKGEVYVNVEGANGELGFYVVSDGSGTPVKVRVRPPCFNFVAAMADMCVGHPIADLVPTFGSINMIGGELDR
ncbi:MAG: NADH-quinone oxidoreductase subunit D [SAR324 cluster bacterium]|nr:NADH-quinone oxidoreductase subunit D [SAR324 cluster bacterium]